MLISHHQIFVVSFQAALPRGEWHCLAPELLDKLKAKLEESEDDATLQTMKSLRLVNCHWSRWATGAITMLKITGHRALSMELVAILAKTFANLSTLHLCKMDRITNIGLHTLSELPNLTCLDVSGKGPRSVYNITDRGMIYLGRLTALRDLALCESVKITDAGVQELTSLTSLSRLCLQCSWVKKMDSARWLARLTGLRELMFMGGGINDGLYYTTLTSLTRLSLSYVASNFIDRLASLVNIRDLRLSECCRIKNVGLKHLTSFTSLTRLKLGWCSAVTDDGIRHFKTLTSLTMLGLSDAKITDNSMIYLVGLTGMEHLELNGCGRITDVGLRDLTSLTHLTVLSLRWSLHITSEGASYLGRLTNLQDLNLSGCETMPDVGIMHLTLLASLRRLNLRYCKCITDMGLMCLGSLTTLRDLDLGRCNKITDIGLRHLASLTLLTRLALDGLDKITDKGVECLVTMTGLRVLGLSLCWGVSNNFASRDAE